ncbi:hypothetical protein PV325_013773 [Microctonus aethiopoides]|nr:hypothetical protein PV325_013773 [Microctonus aethiopoides]
MIVLMNQLETTSDGGDYSRVKRQAEEEETLKNNNHKILMIRKAKKIPIKKIINHKHSPSHKNFRRNIISYLKQLFNGNKDDKLLETSKISGSIAEDYSTTECDYEDDTTLEENIITSQTSTTSSILESSTQPLSSASPEITSSSALDETICETEEKITSTTIINTDEITTTPMPIAKTTNSINIINDRLKNILTTSEYPPYFSSTGASDSTDCDYDTEIETTEPSVNTNEPLVDDNTNDDNDDCVNPIERRSSRKLLEKLMNIKPLVKQLDKVNSTTLLKLRERNLQTSRIKLIKNLKIIKRKTSLLSSMNNLKLGQFNEMKNRIKKRMKIGRTLKSYEFIEPIKESLLPTITPEGNEYDYDNSDDDDINVEYLTNKYDNAREIIDETLTPIAEELSENFNTTVDKFMNKEYNTEKLVNVNSNNSDIPDNNSNETNSYCTSCICDIEYALMSLKALLEMRSDLLNRISQYSCDKFVQIGKYLDVTSASLSRRRAVDDTLSYNSTQQTLIKINDDEVLKYIQNDVAEDLLSIDEANLNEHETLYIPESSYLINIPCSNDNKTSLIMSKSQPNYIWMRHDGGPISGIIRDNGDLELYQVDRVLNVGNYSCIMTYIDSDDKKLIKNVYEHTVKSVTLPQYIIRGVNHYNLDNLDEFKLETLFTYLKHILSNHRHGRLFPIKKDENAELKVEQKQKQKEIINVDINDANGDDVGLLMGCPVGYRLESNYCEPCPSGFYSRDLSWHCQQCPLGTYQLKTGANTCEKCTNPFLWSSLSIVLIILGLLIIMCLIGIITFWPMWCKKRNKKYKIYREFSDDDEYSTVPLIPLNMNENLICSDSWEQNDVEEDLPNKKKLLIYGINLLPTRRMMKH